MRADLDKATRFNKDNLEGSPYVRKLLEVPSDGITRLVWAYFANDKESQPVSAAEPEAELIHDFE